MTKAEKGTTHIIFMDAVFHFIDRWFRGAIPVVHNIHDQVRVYYAHFVVIVSSFNYHFSFSYFSYFIVSLARMEEQIFPHLAKNFNVFITENG